MPLEKATAARRQENQSRFRYRTSGTSRGRTFQFSFRLNAASLLATPSCRAAGYLIFPFLFVLILLTGRLLILEFIGLLLIALLLIAPELLMLVFILLELILVFRFDDVL
jgi:hypothetical protein